MWAWVLHRISGVVIALYGIAHLWVISNSRIREGAGFDHIMEFFERPWLLAMELLLLWAVLYHTFNGFRILLFDLGIGIRVQKPLFWGLMALAVLIQAAGTYALLPYIVQGKPFT